jgi:hypothetical protein
VLIRTTRSRAEFGNRLRFAVLAVLGVVVGHDAVYAVGHGLGDGYRTAMSALGHDAYWVPLTVMAVVAALAVLVTAASTILGLRRRLSAKASVDHAPAVSYRSTVWRIWPRLFLVVVAAFVVQENLEQWRSFEGATGIDVLVTTSPLAVPVLALVTLVLAAVGALVRWRIEHLRARLAHSAAHAARAVDPISPSPEWRLADIAAVAWLLVRRDAGRAPPRLLLTD